ncbi:MAG: alpha/beta hydrolase [Pseudomonadales bacterium]
MPDPTSQQITLTLPQTASVTVRQQTYRNNGSDRPVLDLYQPSEPATGARPAVLFVNGYPDPGFRRVMGCAYKDMGATVAWARLVGATGMAAITYENVEPLADARRVLDFVAANADGLGVDPERIGVWACSGHAPTALALLAGVHASNKGPTPRCATLLYGYLLDLPGHNEVSAAAAQFGFLPGPASLDAILPVPTLVLRAGRDGMPGLLPSMDRFVAAALAGGFPLTLLNHPDAAHAFDLDDGRPESLTALHSVLDFLTRRLRD